MNYLAHGYLHLDAPYVLAGTALPDWLGAIARRSRLRPHRLPEEAPADVREAALLRGVRRHHADDRRFHGGATFEALIPELAKAMRAQHHAGEGVPRASFVAHVLIEMLLDAWLMERDLGLADAYYAALERVDPEHIQAFVNRHAQEPSDRIAEGIRRFRRVQFLRTYLDDEEIAARLDHVLRRVRQPRLPLSFATTVAAARTRVYGLASALLPLPGPPPTSRSPGD